MALARNRSSATSNPQRPMCSPSICRVPPAVFPAPKLTFPLEDLLKDRIEMLWARTARSHEAIPPIANPARGHVLNIYFTRISPHRLNQLFE
jgi:hypothetical protein